MTKTKRQCAPLEAIPEALEKTGFLLEYRVGEQFKSAGWTVLGNRYYVDDVDEKTRELDLVAYQVGKSDDIDVVTVVLVSCKKDAEHTWAFMTKERPKSDPNLDWEPVHWWTDYEPLASYLASEDWRHAYVHGDPLVDAQVFRTTRDVFAFQQISPDGKSPKNDKAIFDSITSLLKAMDYELASVPRRAKNRKRVYLFSLLAVVDAPMVDVQYARGIGKAIEIDRLAHVARYIVRKKEVHAYVHFVRSDKVLAFVASLGKLAEYNLGHMKTLVGTSYGAIRTNAKVRELFAKRLEPRIKFRLNALLDRLHLKDRITSVGLSFADDTLNVEMDVEGETASILDADSEAREVVRVALQDIARYKGNFVLTWDIPF